MRAMTRTARLASALFVAALLSAGCAGGGDDEAGAGGKSTVAADDQDAPSPAETQDTDQAAYLDCLAAAGVKLTTTSEGVRQVDKDHVSAATLKGAEQKCVDKLPATAGGGGDGAVSAQRLAKARKASACVRGEGFPDYPDPDPKTGEIPVTEDLAKSLKGDPKLVAALQKCGGKSGSNGGGKIGG
ncbi:hypothetical protein V2W30_16915 [Streptomyces sp. Q6]|uniref:Uncharacterized protein n=1 Tax=Streptomyces citrinus TaxID=3118173 RepID=A0ACD5AD90_9ACTN